MPGVAGSQTTAPEKGSIGKIILRHIRGVYRERVREIRRELWEVT